MLHQRLPQPRAAHSAYLLHETDVMFLSITSISGGCPNTKHSHSIAVQHYQASEKSEGSYCSTPLREANLQD